MCWRNRPDQTRPDQPTRPRVKVERRSGTKRKIARRANRAATPTDRQTPATHTPHPPSSIMDGPRGMMVPWVQVVGVSRHWLVGWAGNQALTFAADEKTDHCTEHRLRRHDGVTTMMRRRREETGRPTLFVWTHACSQRIPADRKRAPRGCVALPSLPVPVHPRPSRFPQPPHIFVVQPASPLHGLHRNVQTKRLAPLPFASRLPPGTLKRSHN